MKIVVATATQSGLDTLDMLRETIDIHMVLGLDGGQNKKKISGHADVSAYCQNAQLSYLGVKSYGLKCDQDQARLLSEEIDVLLVLGWQRLIPAWLIEHTKFAVIGGHGSAVGITEGRGRSPQNRASILGRSSFSISLFKIESGVDSGPVLMEKTFTYSQLDDIETSYFKTSWIMSDMMIELLNSSDPMRFDGLAQVGVPAYLPKRAAEDGRVDWGMSSAQIYNFVRGLTHPYPGAFTFLGEIRVNIWSLIPFDVPVDLLAYRPEHRTDVEMV
ncbi:MAG: formyltransferase family protein [Halioglobus sp.]